MLSSPEQRQCIFIVANYTASALSCQCIDVSNCDDIGQKSVQLQIPAGENLARIELSGQPVTLATVYQVSPLQLASQQVIIAGSDVAGNPVTQLPVPLSLSFAVSPPAGLNPNLARVYVLASLGNAQRVPASSTHDLDGTVTLTTQTADLSSYVVAMPGVGTPIPAAFLPSIFDGG